MGRPSAGPTPLVEVLAEEEQLASRPVLLGGNRALRGQLADRVRVQTEVPPHDQWCRRRFRARSGDQVGTKLANTATRVSPGPRPISPEPSPPDDTPMPPGLRGVRSVAFLSAAVKLFNEHAPGEMVVTAVPVMRQVRPCALHAHSLAILPRAPEALLAPVAQVLPRFRAFKRHASLCGRVSTRDGP